jgi:hypothetical protein
LNRGKHYFEVTILKYEANATISIGWADQQFFGDYNSGQCLGDDQHSWSWVCSSKDSPNTQLQQIKTKAKGAVGLRSSGQKVVCNNDLCILWPKDGAAKWKKGVVIGCAVDLDLKKMYFSYNGSFAPNDGGTAFEIIANADNAFLCPGVSLNSEAAAQINFGERPFKYNPPTLKVLGELMPGESEHPSDVFQGVHAWLTSIQAASSTNSSSTASSNQTSSQTVGGRKIASVSAREKFQELIELIGQFGSKLSEHELAYIQQEYTKSPSVTQGLLTNAFSKAIEKK